MKKFVINTIAALAAIAATPALAADWTYIGETDTAKFYVDADSAIQAKDGFYLWVKLDRFRVDTDGSTRTLAKEYIDCTNLTRGPVQIVKYRLNGTVVNSYNLANHFEANALIPGTVMGDFIPVLCDKVYGERY